MVILRRPSSYCPLLCLGVRRDLINNNIYSTVCVAFSWYIRDIIAVQKYAEWKVSR